MNLIKEGKTMNEIPTKKFYRSKTLWTNVGVIVTSLGGYFTGTASLDTVVPAISLAVVNIILRLITKQPLE